MKFVHVSGLGAGGEFGVIGSAAHRPGPRAAAFRFDRDALARSFSPLSGEK